MSVGQTSRSGRRRRHRRSNPLDYSRKTWMRLTMGGAFVFLYFPIVSLIAFSFNDSKRNITWQGFTLRYYEKAYENSQLHEAFLNSMIVASMSLLRSGFASVIPPPIRDSPPPKVPCGAATSAGTRQPFPTPLGTIPGRGNHALQVPPALLATAAGAR